MTENEFNDELELLTPEEAATRMLDGALLIDVRPADRREEKAIGAVLVNRYEMEKQFIPGAENFIAEAGNPDRPIVVMCGSVKGSAPMAQWLKENGYTNVSHVDGGFDGWKDAGLPVDKVD